MPGRLRKAAIGSACVLALGLSFVVARAGGEPQADDPVVPVIPATKPAAETTTSQLGQAHGLPALAPARPKPRQAPGRDAQGFCGAAPGARSARTGRAGAPVPAGLHAATGPRDAGAAAAGSAAHAPAARSVAPRLLRRLRLMSDARAEKLAHAIRARVSINQPSLVPARVVRDGAGRLRIQLQRLDDPTLAELLAAGEVSRKDGVRIVYSVAAAVEALRRAGLVARDLRPGRIHFSAERGAVLADTGVPLELMPRTLRPGDPEAAFRSPEERAGKPIGARSNVYSLGVLLRAVLDRPVSSGLPKQVEMVIARATATDPERRYAGPRDFIIAAVKALGLQIRQRPGGGTEFVRVPPEAPAAAQRSRPSQPRPASGGSARARRGRRTPEPAPEPARSPQARAEAARRAPKPAPGAGPCAQARAEACARAQPAPEPARSRKPAFASPASRACRGPACPGRRFAFHRSRDRTFACPPCRGRRSPGRGSRSSACPR